MIDKSTNHTPMVYVACPYTHADYRVRTLRATIASAYAVHVWVEEGLAAYSPLTHHHGLVTVNYAWSLAWKKNQQVASFDRAILHTCDELRVLQLPDWEKSSGVQRAIDEATGLGMPITYVDQHELSGPSYRSVCSLSDFSQPAEQDSAVITTAEPMA